MIYIASFILSAGIISVGERNRKYGKVFVCLGLLIPIILGTIRSLSVGIDVMTYELPCWNIAKRMSSLKRYLLSISDIEKSFLLMTYCCAKISKDIWMLNLCIQIIANICIYRSLVISNVEHRWIGMLTFYMMYYGETYNTMRQSMAICVSVLALSFLVNEKYKKSLVLFTISIMLHKSAIISLIYYFFSWIYKKRRKKLCLFAFYCITFVISELYIEILSIVAKIIPFFPKKYIGVRYLFADSGSFFVKNIIIVLVGLLISYFLNVSFSNKFFEMLLYTWMLLTVLIPFCNKVGFAGRITGYFQYTIIFLIPRMNLFVKKSLKNQFLCNLFIMVSLCLFFWINYYITDHAGIFPYKTIWQD